MKKDKEKLKLFKLKKPRLKVKPPKVMKTKKDYNRQKMKLFSKKSAEIA